MISKSGCMAILLLVLLIYFCYNKNNELLPVAGGNEVDNLNSGETMSDLSDLSTDTFDDNYSNLDIENKNENNLDNTNLVDELKKAELEQEKQNLKLAENQLKLQQLEEENKKLKEIENKQNVDLDNVAPLIENFEKDKEKNMNSYTSCNNQQNIKENTENFHLDSHENCNSDYFVLSDDYLTKSDDDKLKPSELLPSDSLDMKGENFLQRTERTNSISTQQQRSRLNYDLRSTPANPRVDVSPWNISTTEADTSRRSFEIGASSE